MGSGPSALSRTSTAVDVANSLVALGSAYEIYRHVVTDNAIDGKTIMSFRSKKEMEETFRQIVPNMLKLYIIVISNNILELIKSNRNGKRKKASVEIENRIGNLISFSA